MDWYAGSLSDNSYLGQRRAEPSQRSGLGSSKILPPFSCLLGKSIAIAWSDRWTNGRPTASLCLWSSTLMMSTPKETRSIARVSRRENAVRWASKPVAEGNRRESSTGLEAHRTACKAVSSDSTVVYCQGYERGHSSPSRFLGNHDA